MNERYSQSDNKNDNKSVCRSGKHSECFRKQLAIRNIS